LKDAIDENEEYFLLNVDLAYAPFDILVDTYNITITDSGELIACTYTISINAYSGVELCISKATSSILKSFMYEYNYICICKGFKDVCISGNMHKQRILKFLSVVRTCIRNHNSK